MNAPSTPQLPHVPTIRLTTATPSQTPSSALAPKSTIDTRRRLVPRKSKLGLSAPDAAETPLLSPARGAASASRSFNIYVDPADDPDIGEIVVLKKKKSRGGLNDVEWGPLGDVTNAPRLPTIESNGKPQERDKWWTLRKGKGSKRALSLKAFDAKQITPVSEDEIVKPREQFSSIRLGDSAKNSGNRPRSHSLDTCGILNGSLYQQPTQNFISVPMPDDDETPRGPRSRSRASASAFSSQSGSSNEEGKTHSRNGSIALRAMRSVRSLARMSSWAKSGEDESEAETDLEIQKTKKVKKKEKMKKERTLSISSISSFEVFRNTIGTVRRNSDRTGTMRSVSSQSTAVSSTSSNGTIRNSQRSSISSSGSEEQISHSSTKRRRLKSNGLTARKAKAGPSGKEETVSRGTKGHRSRRPTLASLFSRSDTNSASEHEENSGISLEPELETSVTLAEISLAESAESEVTPKKKRSRPRPVSEQLLSKPRPTGVVSDVETGTIRILDAVTTDLASLINRLDLESTPTATPRRPRTSTLKQSKRDAPSEQPSPTSDKGRKFNFQSSTPTSVGRHPQRSHSISVAEVLSRGTDSFLLPSSNFEHGNDSLVSDVSSKRQSLRSLSIDGSLTEWDQSAVRSISDSFATFGKRALQNGFSFRSRDISSLLDEGEDDVFLDINRSAVSQIEHRLSAGSFLTRGSLEVDAASSFEEGSHVLMLSDRRSSLTSRHESTFILDHPSTMLPPLPPSPSPSQLLDSSPSYYRSSSSLAVPTGRVTSCDNADSPITPVDNVTKISFDFTEDLEQLTCGDMSEQQIFATQIDEAFKTPRKLKQKPPGSRPRPLDEIPAIPKAIPSLCLQAHLIALPDSPPLDSDCGHSFSSNSASGHLDVDRANEDDLCIKHPPQSSFLGVFSKPIGGQLRPDFKFGGANGSAESHNGTSSECPLHGADASRNSMRYSKYSVDSGNSAIGKKMSMADFFAALSQSNGEASDDASRASLAFTLSDIIPPNMHDSRRGSYYSVNDDEASMLNSIFAKAAEETQDYQGSIRDDASSIYEDHNSHAHSQRLPSMHSRQNSDCSFNGLSTFNEIRRCFEYGPSRPGFYPPANFMQQNNKNLLVPGHQWRDSLVSLASVSSYGHVLRSGVKDPFGYANPAPTTSNQPRPISGDLSTTVDDTFSFLKRGIRPRQDSDASSLRVPIQRRPSAHVRRIRRAGVDSMMSVNSGPPVSLYNRGFSYYGSKQNDVNIAAQLGLLTRGASHPLRERTTSVDSMASGFSARQVGRPGIGDKMFDSARDLGIPLSAIAASPSQFSSRKARSQIFSDDDDFTHDDGDARSIFSHDSILEAQPNNREVPPLPIHSHSEINQKSSNANSPKRSDASTISMFSVNNASHQSLLSSMNDSPCARAEKRANHFYRRPLERIPSGDAADLLSAPASTYISANASLLSLSDVPPSPASRHSNKSFNYSLRPDDSRISLHFGSNRMSMAQKGLLERASLENFCLTGEGEDEDQPAQMATITFRRPVRPRNKSDAQGTVNQKKGTDTPPLCHSGRTSLCTGSQSSIDLERVSAILSNSASSRAPATRARKNASELRRRTLEARASRASSIYETIPEEKFGQDIADELGPSVSQRSSVISIDDNEPAVRMMLQLQDEARLALEASQQQWIDTAYSTDALQAFAPPNTVAAWKAILEHSQKNFVPLPSDFHGCLRPARSHTFSRTSPYPTNFSMSRRAF